MSAETIEETEAYNWRIREREKRRVTSALDEANRRIKAFSRLYTSPQAAEAFEISQQVISEIRDTEAQRQERTPR